MKIITNPRFSDGVEPVPSIESSNANSVTGGTTIVNVSMTPSGLNRVLYAFVACGTSQTITGCTWNGLSMTSIGSTFVGSGTTGRRIEAFYYINPDTVTANVRGTISANNGFSVAAVCLSGANQSAPHRTPDTQNGVANTASGSPTSGPGTLVLSGIGIRDTSGVDNIATTNDELQQTAGSWPICVANEVGGSPTTAMDFSWTTSDSFAMISFAVDRA